MRHPALIAVAVTSVIAACAGCMSMPPSYERPALPVPDDYAVAQVSRDRPGSTPAVDLAWRDYFADARLRTIIEMALTNNRDLRVAVLNIEQARAQYGIQRSQSFPTFSASAGASIDRVPGDQTETGAAGTSRQYSATLGVSAYELDLFGRVRSLNQEALQTYLATREARRATHISLVAQVAVTYLQWAADVEHLALARHTLQTQSDAFALTQRRVDVGMASNLTLRQQQFSVETARGDESRYTGLLAQGQNALALLVGAPIPAELAPQAMGTTMNALPPLAAGVPSDVLLRRPDVLSSELQLKAANASIGAARAAFYPRITLTGSAGTISSELKQLFSSGSGAWSFLPQITLPIFDGGSNRSNLDIANVAQAIAVANYEKAIQSAFREVADGLALRATIGGQMQAQSSLVSAADEALVLSDARFTRGFDSYLSVLDAQRTLYAAQQQLIDNRLAQSSNDVRLYRALGGGWSGDAIAQQ